jgi:small subunit ribosomal protein S2
MQTPELLDMLKAGVHFGHKTSKWHPNMRPFIFTTKQDVHIINLEATQNYLQKAAEVAKQLAQQGKTILFIGAKRQAAPLVQKYAEECGMPFVSNRWLGGTLTNFKHVSNVPRKLTRLKKDRETGDLKKYTKKEQLEFDREIDRLQILVGGVESLMKLPDAVFIVDLVKEKTALHEAQQMGIPVIAICDTNADPVAVEYPIPANDDAVKAIDFILSYMSQAINEGKAAAQAAQPQAE